MSQWGVQLVIGRLITDESFRRQFEERGRECLIGLSERGIDLNDAEVAALVEASPRLWSRMAARIDRRLRKAATTFGRDEARVHARLAAREQQVLRGVFQGLTNKEIATDVGVSESSVKATLQRLFRKTHVRTRAQLIRIVVAGCLVFGCLAGNSAAQTPLTWPEIRARFEASNPTLRAGQLAIEESKAAETTAYVRPNPQFSLTNDQINLFGQPGDRAQNLITVASVSYLHEREQKRELRLDSARGATAIATFAQADLMRNLLFTLRSAFVQMLQAKAFRVLAQENLTTYDQVLALSRDRLQAGDIAQIDLDRLQLQRVQYESDAQTADVNLRLAALQLRRLLNDSTPVDQFDVSGPFDFAGPAETLDVLRKDALDTRPDLKAAMQAVEEAKTEHRLAVANGSADPVFSVDAGFSQSPQSYTPPLSQYVGVGVSVPLRFFDRNQGEKLRTELDVKRSEALTEAAQRQVFSDVDSAYAAVMSAVALLQPYRATYLDQATRVRDTVTFSYQNGGASLLEFVQAQQEYRSVQITYVNLVAAFLNAVDQLNLAIGQEVIQ
jgi:outer membrane protein, heavy metal efflux system